MTSEEEDSTPKMQNEDNWKDNIYEILEHIQNDGTDKPVKKRLWNTSSAIENDTTTVRFSADKNSGTKIKKAEKEGKVRNEEATITSPKIAGPDLMINTQEPWPKDVKLYQPYDVEQILLSDNANCLAVQAFLRMCNLDFQIVSKANAEFMSPSGKVPFIRCGAFVIPEMEGIVQFVNNKGISLTTDLEPEQKSDIRAYMSLVHNVLENAELYLCWRDKETYNEVTWPRNGSVYPWPLNYIQTWSKRSAVYRRLKVMNWYKKTLEDVFQEVENCCQALADRLEQKEYFYGKSYTELDALIYGHVYSILNNPLPAKDNRLAFVVNSFNSLIAHCQKIDKDIMKRESSALVGESSAMTISGFRDAISAIEANTNDYLMSESKDNVEPTSCRRLLSLSTLQP